MRAGTYGKLLAVAFGIAFASTATAQERPTIAIMPTQYFSADAQSADNVTRGLAEQFAKGNYRVLPQDRSQAAFDAMNLSLTRDIGDPQILAFGRSAGTDLVAHPQLLAVGLPFARTTSAGSVPKAVLYLRVLNVHTGRALYTRQIAYEFNAEGPTPTDFQLPQEVATATANEVSQLYFQRVAGSREEIGRPSR
jgi:hypothetical protein